MGTQQEGKIGAVFHQRTESGFASAQSFLGTFPVANINEAFQQIFPPGDLLPHDGFDDGAAAAVSGQQHALGIIHGLTKVGDGTAASLGRTNEIKALCSNHRLFRAADQAQSPCVRVDDPVSIRLDDDNSRLYVVENILEFNARFLGGSLGELALGDIYERSLDHVGITVLAAGQVYVCEHDRYTAVAAPESQLVVSQRFFLQKLPGRKLEIAGIRHELRGVVLQELFTGVKA